MKESEIKRRELQEAYDASHSQLERNKKGQFATPYKLALSIMKDAAKRVDSAKTMLEPSCGTGVFFSAANEVVPHVHITGVEKHEPIATTAASLCSDQSVAVVAADFFDTIQELSGFDLLVTNPPYTRHHHLSADEKSHYGAITESMTGIHLSQLAGLHTYFILAGTETLRPNGIASWLIPSELFSVNYGSAVRSYITSNVTVERVHFFDNGDLQFTDALVSSCVLVLRKRPAEDDDMAQITCGNFDNPARSEMVSIKTLRTMDKWQHYFTKEKTNTCSRIGDYFNVKRGLATGAESFYAQSRSAWHELGIDDEWLIPVLPAPRFMRDKVVESDAAGWPVNHDRALLSIPNIIEENDLPTPIVNYLATCPDKVRNSYTAQHRKKWYSIEKREPAPIVCTYMSRSDTEPFRFVRNYSNAVVTTAYLCLYPKRSMANEALNKACEALNKIEPHTLISSGREYGGGLRKLEPKELLSVPFEHK